MGPLQSLFWCKSHFYVCASVFVAPQPRLASGGRLADQNRSCASVCLITPPCAVCRPPALVLWLSPRSLDIQVLISCAAVPGALYFVSKGSMCVCAMFWFLGLPACCAKIHLATHIKRASIKVHDFALQENAGALHATQDSGLSHGFLWGGCGVRQTVLPLCTFSTGHARKSPLPQAMDLYFSI